MLTVLIGGARSGKSDLAVEMGERHGRGVTFVATAEPLDEEMTVRIERHRADRPDWPVIEAPLDLDAALSSAAEEHLVIIDCLTLWVANAMRAGWPGDLIDRRGAASARVAAVRPSPTVVVTNEVGLGVHPETELGRDFRDLLGRVNRTWAGVADLSLFMVAGRAMLLRDPRELLGWS